MDERSERTPEQLQDRTLEGRRAARARFAADRIRKIVDGSPPLTEAQLQKLALLLYGGARE